MPTEYRNRKKVLVSFEEDQLKLMDKHIAKVKRKKAKSGEKFDRSAFLQEAASRAIEEQ